MPLLITFLAGISIVVGAAITKIAPSADKVRQISFSLALGALLSLLLFDLGPDILEAKDSLGIPVIAVLVVLGAAVLKILDLFIPDHEDTAASHDHGNAVHIGLISSLAIILHNIVEGMTVYSLSLANTRQGAVFAFGIALHNIPMGMLIYASMAERRKSVRRTVLSTVTLSTLVGGILMNLISDSLTENLMSSLVCIAAGMIIYIVFLELFPHVLRTRPVLLSLISSVIGFVLVFASCMIAAE